MAGEEGGMNYITLHYTTLDWTGLDWTGLKLRKKSCIIDRCIDTSL